MQFLQDSTRTNPPAPKRRENGWRGIYPLHVTHRRTPPPPRPHPVMEPFLRASTVWSPLKARGISTVPLVWVPPSSLQAPDAGAPPRPGSRDSALPVALQPLEADSHALTLGFALSPVTLSSWALLAPGLLSRSPSPDGVSAAPQSRVSTGAWSGVTIWSETQTVLLPNSCFPHLSKVPVNFSHFSS